MRELFIMQTSIKKPTEPFSNNKLNEIFITRGDLNKALFIGNHYTYQYGKGHSYTSDLIDIGILNTGKRLSVSAKINHITGSQNIEMDFLETSDRKLKLMSGSITHKGIKESLVDPKRLSNVLLCLYRHVRTASDPKWAVDFKMITEAREAAAQLLDTGMLPKIIYNDGQISYTAPAVGNDKICNGNCGKCRLKL